MVRIGMRLNPRDKISGFENAPPQKNLSQWSNKLRCVVEPWSVYDLYHILFYHWDEHTVYRDEPQRCHVDTGILMASYFGCRPVSTFDTRIKFEDEVDARKPADHPTVAGHSEDYRDDFSDQDDTDWDDEQMTLVNSASHTDHDGDTSACSDDDGDAGLDDTGSLLWRHIAFFIATHRILGERSLLFAKGTITHTEGENNCPRDAALSLSPPHI